MKLISRDYDPVTGVTDEYWHHTDGSNKLTIRRLQDVEGVIRDNKEQFNSHSRIGYGDSNGLHKIATIPLITIERWLREDGFDWFNSTDKDRRAKLNAPENQYLLVRPGRL